MTHLFPAHSNSYWKFIGWLICRFFFGVLFISDFFHLFWCFTTKNIFYRRDLNYCVIFLSWISIYLDNLTFMSISGSNTLNTTSLLFIDHVLAFALHLVPLASSWSGLQPQHATTSRWSSGSYEAYAPRYIYAPVVYCSTLLIKKIDLKAPCITGIYYFCCCIPR